ncbi:MAG: MiaB/RimO family radical SAM methylthiotransferase [Oscillospiraceae bacterium]|nr:MiaB/RimO family radical SAM methylthiotransferase [Oscillospiraceae bacterium]
MKIFTKTFFITTFGCKVNQYESSAISALMTLRGLVQAKSGSDCDVHIINSCTVTDHTDRKVKSLITRLKKERPDMKVILCGCFPKAFPQKAAETGADEVIHGKFTECESYKNSEDFLPPISLQKERTRAFLKIQDGCNRNCAYCIIPKARDVLYSRSVSDIAAEAAALVKAGHKEIVVTGINLCLYEPSLIDAVERICRVDGLVRVRLGSLEPDLISETDIKRLSRLPNLTPHFHLSLQSGSDRVLSRMNRRYTTSEYRLKAELIRRLFDSPALTTDIIAGFPGETDDDFAETLAFAREMRFAKIHGFAYSVRGGTAAAEMTGQVPKSVKVERMSRLSETAQSLRRDFFESLIGTKREVLVEKSGFGHTACYCPVKIVGDCEENCVVTVTIESVGDGFCQGVVDNE